MGAVILDHSLYEFSRTTRTKNREFGRVKDQVSSYVFPIKTKKVELEGCVIEPADVLTFSKGEFGNKKLKVGL